MQEKCLDDSPLQGACCTNHCRHRRMCKVHRIPLLIHSVVISRRMKRIFADAYINEIAGLA